MNLNKLNNKFIKKLSLSELKILAKEIRHFMIDSNSKTGGHIGANLGVVELSIALHYVFDSPKDSFVFDTGHVGYTHKILTGRAKLFESLNSFKGMNRFISPKESKHDKIESSHAGTSISTALGFAISNKLDKSNKNTIAIIGDGALCEGVALEAINHVPKEKVNLLIVVNDNGFAISKGYGAIHDMLSSQKNKSKNFFESLGYKISEPIDGHNINAIIRELTKYKRRGGIRILHIKTDKGRGYKVAEKNSNKMHYSMPFDKKSGQLSSLPNSRSVQNFASAAILKNMQKNKKIVCITPSTRYATDLDRVFEKYKDRCFDPGMTEQHALSFANGLSISGKLPVVFFQSTFLQRSFDQLIHDVAFANKNILILSVRSGFAGYDNATHHGIYDISYLKGIPNLQLIYPENVNSLEKNISKYLRSPNGPVCILFPYGFEENYNYSSDKIGNFNKNKSAIITIGNMLKHAKNIQKELLKKKKEISIFAIEKIKPLDEKYIFKICNKYNNIFSLEQNVSSGGLNESLSKLLINNKNINFKQFSLDDKFYPGGNDEEIYDDNDFSAYSIAKKIYSCIKS